MVVPQRGASSTGVGTAEVRDRRESRLKVSDFCILMVFDEGLDCLGVGMKCRKVIFEYITNVKLFDDPKGMMHI